MNKTPAKAVAPRETKTTVQIRRAPKYLPFMITGTLLGVILAVILNALIPADQQSAEPILGYLVVFIGAVGFGLGSLAALLLDRLFRAQSKTLEATKLEG